MESKPKNSGSRWFQSERDWLAANWEDRSVAEIAEHLKRSVGAVASMATFLGVKKKCRRWRWTDERKRKLVELYDRSPKLASQTFGITIHSARVYHSRWRPNVVYHFTKAEDDLIRELFPRHRDDELRSALPNRTWAAIRQRACRLKCRRPNIRYLAVRARYELETQTRKVG